MDYNFIPFSRLNGDQIKTLARLHHRVMHSLLTDMGLPFIERYYQIARADASVIGICALNADGNPIGWAAGSPNPNQVNRRMRDAPGWFIIRMLGVIITRPLVIPRLLASAGTASVGMSEGTVELTYLGVDETVRKQGLGGALLNAFIEAARERKFASVELSVEADNAGAIALYTGVGFRIIASFKEGVYDRHRMELKLG